MQKVACQVQRDVGMHFEEAAYGDGALLPAGVDEVGRGCLAGPVVAAAVILPRHFFAAEINDSKKLSAAQRWRAFGIILKHAKAFGVAMIEAPEIDKINILQASLKAMRLAVSRLKLPSDYLLVDGRDSVPGLALPQKPIIEGDGQSLSIAAASIVAKVTRDRLMRFYARQFPSYAFHENKGYGTAMHRLALKEFGPCILHRRSFSGVV